MGAKQGVGATLACLLATGAWGLEPQVGGLRSYATPEYTLITHDNRAPNKLPRSITRMDTLLRSLLQIETRRRSGMPTYIYVARGNVWDEYLQPGEGIAGEFVAGRFANYLLIDNRWRDVESLRHSLNHEYTHLFLRDHVQGVLPLWLDEGFAELISGAEFRGNRVDISGLPELDDRRLPMERVLRVDRQSREYQQGWESRSFHMMSWAMVHRAMFEDPAFRTRMLAYTAALDRGDSVDAALQSGFGLTAAQLDDEMGSYLNRSRFRGVRLKLDVPAAPDLGTGKPMDRLDALEFLADIMLASGTKPARLADVVEAGHRHAPQSPRAQLLALRVAAHERDDAEMDRLTALLEPHFTDQLIARGAGLAAFARVRNPDANLADAARLRYESLAFDLLDRVILARPDDAEAVWGYATVAARHQRDLTTALRRVRQALRFMPMNADLAIVGNQVCKASGDAECQAAFLKDALRFANLPEHRAWVSRQQ